VRRSRLTWNDIGLLAAIIVSRTALNYFLRQKTDRVEFSLDWLGKMRKRPAIKPKDRHHGSASASASRRSMAAFQAPAQSIGIVVENDASKWTAAGSKG
jgi:hypothetical protein